MWLYRGETWYISVEANCMMALCNTELLAYRPLSPAQVRLNDWETACLEHKQNKMMQQDQIKGFDNRFINQPLALNYRV